MYPRKLFFIVLSIFLFDNTIRKHFAVGMIHIVTSQLRGAESDIRSIDNNSVQKILVTNGMWSDLQKVIFIVTHLIKTSSIANLYSAISWQKDSDLISTNSQVYRRVLENQYLTVRFCLQTIRLRVFLSNFDYSMESSVLTCCLRW